MLLRIIGIIFPVLAIAGVGLLYGRWRRPDMSFANQLNMDIFVPALVFWALVDKPLDMSVFRDLTIGGVLVVLGSGLLIAPLLPLLKVDFKTFLPPMMFNNSGNMGLPVALFAFGEDILQAAVVLFIVEMLLHFSVGLYIMDHKTRLLGLFRMPIVIATVAGLVFGIAGWELPEPLANTIKMLGQVCIPLLLFALGVRLVGVDFRDWRIGLLGAVLCPLSGVAVVLLVSPLLNLSPVQQDLLLVFGALPPAVLNYIVAEQYGQEPGRVASIVMLGNLGSLIAIPAALYFALT
jgi:predicted permease